MFRRRLFQPEHDEFREVVRKFIDREIRPYHDQWERDGIVPRELWLAAGESGLLCCTIPEEYGGLGLDYLFDVVVFEEMARSGFTGPGFMIHCDLVATYVYSFGTEAQRRYWLPKMVRGEAIGSLGMTEPHAGSDLRNIRTRAVLDGDHYIINGQKVFISNGQLCDLVVLATRTATHDSQKGITLFLIDTSLPGFKRGRNLEKLGLKAQDTSELFFEGVQVPVENLLGGAEGEGMHQLMHDLPYERTVIAVGAVGAMEGGIDATLAYVRERKTFGQPVFSYQNTRFKLAELASIARIARVFTDRCIVDLVAGRLDTETASMAKWWTTDMQQQVLDECVQLHGGYGYMNEYLVCRLFADSRVQRIYGGTNEIMKEVIARGL